MTALPARGESGGRPSLPHPVVTLDSVESVSIGTLVERLGRLSDDRMRQVCDALAIAVACQG